MRRLTRFVRLFDKRYWSTDYRPGPGRLDSDGRKHIALQARSTNSRRGSFTASGLGDRFHCLTIGWCFSQAHGVPVVLHLTKKKQSGGQFNNKLESWFEVLDLFPKGHIELALHDYEPATEKKWVSYLTGKDIPAEAYWYQDFPGRFAQPFDLEISHYLKNIKGLSAQDLSREIDLPERFVTVQWDSNEEARTLPVDEREKVMERYRQEGYETVIVGGKSENDLTRNSLRHIAYAMSKADRHVGVDSAFMHMAFLYFDFKDIHLYHQGTGFQSHHFLRALENGCRLNLNYG